VCFRVNRRLSYAVGDGRVTFTNVGAKVSVIPQELCELPFLRGYDDIEVLQILANKFVQKEFKSGEVIVESGKPADSIGLIAHSARSTRSAPASTGTRRSSRPWPMATTTRGKQS
jgi:hypothetical protein